MSSSPLHLAALVVACTLFFGGCASSSEETKKRELPPASSIQASADVTDTIEDDFDDDLFADDFFDDEFRDEECTNPPCAKKEPLPDPVYIADPLEGFNRAVFYFNDKLYLYVLKPVARGWRFVAQESVRVGVGNVFNNIGAPLRIANSLLQLRLIGAAEEFSRFALNSTIGLFGWFDLATKSGMKAHNEDFGQTLGSYGIGQGPYLVLPFFGSSSLRDGIGLTTDLLYIEPEVTLLHGQRYEESIALGALQIVNEFSIDKDTYEKVVKKSIDPYLFMRNAYVQRRNAMVKK